MGVVESAPPHPLAMSCPPLPVTFAHTESVYVPSGMAVACCSRVPLAFSTHDHRPVWKVDKTLCPPVAFQPTGVFTLTRSASKEGLRTQLFPWATAQVPALASIDHLLKEWKCGGLTLEGDRHPLVEPNAVGGVVGPRSPAKMT